MLGAFVIFIPLAGVLLAAAVLLSLFAGRVSAQVLSRCDRGTARLDCSASSA